MSIPRPTITTFIDCDIIISCLKDHRLSLLPVCFRCDPRESLHTRVKIIPQLPLALKIIFSYLSWASGVWPHLSLQSPSAPQLSSSSSPTHSVTAVHPSALSNRVTSEKPPMPLQVVKFLSHTFLLDSDPLFTSVGIYRFLSDADVCFPH